MRDLPLGMLAVFLACAGLASCKRDHGRPPPAPRGPAAAANASAAPRDAAPAPTWYRAELSLPKLGALPFFLQVPARGSQGEAIVANGPERIAAHATWQGTHLVVAFPPFGSQIACELGQGGALAGTWTRKSPAFGQAALPFRATPVAAPDPAHRFAGPAAPVDLPAGDWVWHLDVGDGKLIVAAAGPDAVSVVVMLPSGNTSTLAGNARGGQIVLSGFDGTSPYLVTLRRDPARPTHLTGRWIAGMDLSWQEDFTADKAEAPLEIESGVDVASRAEKIDRAELAAPPYAGHPVIVDMGGSWCPSCGSAMPVLIDLYRRYHPQGLQILTILYEFSDDPAYVAKQVADFKAAYHVPWTVVAGDATLDDFASHLPLELVNAEPARFPIALFVRADRTVAAVHAGFPAPEAREAFARVSAEFARDAAALLGHASPGR